VIRVLKEQTKSYKKCVHHKTHMGTVLVSDKPIPKNDTFVLHTCTNN